MEREIQMFHIKLFIILFGSGPRDKGLIDAMNPAQARPPAQPEESSPCIQDPALPPSCPCSHGPVPMMFSDEDRLQPSWRSATR